MITVEDALRIALKAHEGQKDLDGNPVILHPMAVAVAGRNREEQVAGLLHDVVEDTGMTFDELLRVGVDETIVDALRLLTHTDDMTYEEYVNRITTSGKRHCPACEIQRPAAQPKARQGRRSFQTGS